MTSTQYLIYNGELHLSDQLLISPNNRSFKYGDGFFETMKLVNGTILFLNFHLERLFFSLHTMQFDKPATFTKDNLLQQIFSLVSKNNHQHLARIRLTIFRGDGNLYDISNQPNYIIQSEMLPGFPAYNERGLSLCIYKDARKTADAFSNIKNNNFLPYAMAAVWCKKNNFDDALVLNGYGNIAEATTSNIFIVKDNVILTPALTEGCVAGVTRRYLLRCFTKENIAFEETRLTEEDVYNADEMFLTNTGWHIQWIKQLGTKIYTNQTSKTQYQQFITPLLKTNEQ